MPVQTSYPGVYIEELPSGIRTITGVATSVTAFIGRAKKGPVNEPVTVRSYADFERQGFVLAVTEIHARYIKAVRYDQRITVRTWVTELKSRTVTFDYEIIDAESGELFVTGQSKHICLNREGQIAVLPRNWRDWAAQ